MTNPIRNPLIWLLSSCCLLSIWVFSRVTVDDAFITWRYGRNLVEHGIWNYNPANIDVTQGYTNPIYALISIIPNFFGVDIVLFFKLVSTATILAFIYWFIKVTHKSWVMLLIFLSMPATMVHAYAGLETFLFVTLLSALLISIYENSRRISYFLALILFITRPESWLLLVFLPAYYMPIKYPSRSQSGFFEFLNGNLTADHLRIFIASFLPLAVPLSLYLTFNYIYFGAALPNTYYAKKSAIFDLKIGLGYLALLFPLVILVIYGNRKLMALLVIMFSAMIFSYSRSHLVMNYCGRFPYHIYGPIYIFMCYVSVRTPGTWEITPKINLYNYAMSVKRESLVKLVLFVNTLQFLYLSGDCRGLAAYYNKALSAHAAIGKYLNMVSGKYQIKSYAMGEAGMTSYHSNLIAMDTLGLTSSQVTRQGLTREVLENYHIDVIVFYATNSSINYENFNQRPLFDYAKDNNFVEICDVYYSDNFLFKIYSRQRMPDMENICNSSKANNEKGHEYYVKDALLTPPWTYWSE